MGFSILGLTWSEKSVEYQYVVEGVKEKKFETAWPLDGGDERLGDTLFRSDLKYYIVEFKRNFSAFSSEYKKFSADGKDSNSGKVTYDEAKLRLHSKGSGFHFMICGNAKHDGEEPKFVLDSYRYFDCDEANVEIVSEPNALATHEEIRSYLIEYASFKKGALLQLDPYDEEEDGGDSGRAKAVSMLVGVNAKEQRRIWDLRECMRLVMTPKPMSENKNTSKPKVG